MRPLRRTGRAAPQVIAVGNVGLAAGQVFRRQPPKIVVTVTDRRPVAQAAAGDVARRIIAKLLIVARIAAVRALRRRWIARLPQPVVTIVDIGGAVGLTVDHMIDEAVGGIGGAHLLRSEEHTSELQSLMRISYAVF